MVNTSLFESDAFWFVGSSPTSPAVNTIYHKPLEVDMIVADLFESKGSFRARLEQAVWDAWMNDPFFTPSADSIDGLPEDEYDEFFNHVEDVLQFATRYKIIDPVAAVDQYTDSLSSRQSIVRH